MQREDDPEARIRDLERPLADVARTSELGTGQYGTEGAYLPPPLPPMQPYGAPAYGAPAYVAPYPDAYPGPPPRAKSGSGALWLVFAGIAVVVLLMAGGVVIWATSMFRLAPNTRPPVEVPSVATDGQVQIEISPGETVPAVEPPSAAPIPQPGEMLSVAGVGKNETLVCNESLVSVSGVDNTVTITGHCISLSVSGVDNVVTVETADTIGASGFDNQVTYLSGSPQITATGSNIVEQG